MTDTTSPRIGSLFSGYGGLDLGVQSVLGGSVAWHCENDDAPSRILAHHWPHVPNLGDITAVDWAQVEPVDIITGGSPCQDVSAAGKRAGMRPGTRSGLWAAMCDAIDIIRPSLVIWENVRGAYSAGADSAVEPCPICVGNHAGPHLRALGRVVGDLAELGYDTVWTGLRAADVGAPHGRYRVFLAAWPAADTDSAAGGQRWLAAPGEAEGGWAWADAGRRGGAPVVADADGVGHPSGRASGPAAEHTTAPVGGRAAANPTSDGRDERWPEPAGVIGRPHAALGSAPAADTISGGLTRRAHDPVGGPLGGAAVAGIGEAHRTAWGEYKPAIRRWEHLTRPAPAPTTPGRTGAPRLSAQFVEWLMGLPAGHVTDPAIAITRNDQLKALGNGVVPQQAAAAVELLLAMRHTATSVAA